MLINTSLSPDTTAQDLRNSRAADSSSAPASSRPQTSGLDPAQGRLQGPAPLEEGGVSGITDAAGAGRATDFLRTNLVSQYEPALAAQANLNPESVFNLLQ